MGKLAPALALALFLAIVSNCQAGATTIQSCDSLIYCQGQLLDTVQKARIYKDSKTFVDMMQLNDPSVTLENFRNFMESHNNAPTSQQVAEFVQQNFASTGELDNWTPSDFTTTPKFLRKIKDVTVRDFARQLVSIWPTLSRKVNSSVARNPSRHSLIPLPNGFVVPGGRFKEIYYWDSYWIVKGLLISEMSQTVRGVLENFLSLVERYGFVPNGSRVYYLNRSQPPLLSLMVGLYIDETNDLKWLKRHIRTLEEELEWWLSNRTIVVKKDGVEHRLAHYACESGTPRPESYAEDLRTCESHADKETCYKNLKSGAESGWDFSSRWFFAPDGAISPNLTLIDTKRAIPVELNSYLCKAFRELSHFHKLLEDEVNAFKWLQRHETWKRSIEAVFYNETDGIWYDFDSLQQQHRRGFYPSNLAPLWAEAYDALQKDSLGRRAAEYLRSNDITSFQGGIPTSLLHSGEQWDLPNAWPPLQEIVILGLQRTGNADAGDLARIFAERSVNAFVTGYTKHREMFEKYDALHVGEFGGGGEYVVQSGFGWSNGVALSLIDAFYTSNAKKNVRAR
ncbi:unnamed protein product [Phaedon cochleariae]|uniref:Trehalase n=1 Tax=Phaedon cochleariae TaxID=80249 RepID=A0A9P0DH78_PHACE|nr:unnamed protein product [Phaedon cochleariae]